MASPAVISVNRSHGTTNYIRNEPQYAIRVVFTTRLYYKALQNDFVWPDMANCNYIRLDSSHCNMTGHRKMAVRGAAGAHADNPWKYLNRVIV